MFKKRYIYSSILASIIFIILYLLLDINIIFSILLTGLTYIGGIFLYKEKDIRKYDPNLIMHYCYLISKINNYTSIIKDDNINKNINDITKETEKIITMLEQKPNKVTQVYDGFDYYLPLIIKVLDQYIYLNDKKTLTIEEKEFMSDINICLDNIEKEIVRLLKNMNYTKMLDINSRIEIFKQGNRIVNDTKSKGVEDNVKGR